MFYGILVAKEVHGSTCYFYLYSHFKVLLLLSSTPNFFLLISFLFAAAAAAKLLQSCPTLCNPINGSPPGSPIPGILQARTLEWVAISFSKLHSQSPAISQLSLIPTSFWLQGSFLLLVNSDSLYSPLCLLCDFNSLMDLRRVVDFQFVQFFLIVITSKLFTYWTRNWKF